MAGTAADVALLPEVIAGKDEYDPRQKEVRTEEYGKQLTGNIGGLRLGGRLRDRRRPDRRERREVPLAEEAPPVQPQRMALAGTADDDGDGDLDRRMTSPSRKMMMSSSRTQAGPPNLPDLPGGAGSWSGGPGRERMSDAAAAGWENRDGRATTLAKVFVP